MIGSCGKGSALVLGGAAMVLFGVGALLIAMAIQGCADRHSGSLVPTASDSQPGSSGPGVPVFDPNTGQTSSLPPEEAADAIRSYWTPERMRQARPTP